MKRVIATLLFLAALAAGPWVISAVSLEKAGIVVTGQVIAKQEAFLMPGGDTARHIFEITYEYRPLDAPYGESVKQRVDAKFYRTLRAGSPVQVRYSPSRLLRTVAGMGLYLEGASPFSRLNHGPPDRGDMLKAGALAVAAILGLMAYWKKSIPAGLIAAAIAVSCFPGVLLAACGLILFPALFWAARRKPGKGYGPALLTTIALCAAVVYWRVPQASPFPPGPVSTGTAVVRLARLVDEIWSDTWETSPARSNGVKIRQPFEMVDLEFTPEGAAEPIHVLDRIDRNSVPGLREGAVVRIEYAALDPDSARIAGATRHYAGQITTDFLLLAYGIGAVLTFLLVPLGRGIQKLVRSSEVLRALTDPESAMTRMTQMSEWSRLPKDDPQRKALEAAIAAHRNRRPTGDGIER